MYEHAKGNLNDLEHKLLGHYLDTWKRLEASRGREHVLHAEILKLEREIRRLSPKVRELSPKV